ncbi:unnamed protein product [Lactuca virosa]|uniref:Protein kinase domain-containing protein n=1 Tax=Lactuca virosa TaxID=75947 RepID=A0AAU9N4T9_9ASTR|nr:unnamed protein product [Lactuca virosa]
MSLNWEIRQQIVFGAAKAVTSIQSRGLLCGVLKSSNFLIQSDFSPRLSSYETSYLISTSMIIRRNCGRMVPKLKRTQSISKSFSHTSDVYSFGILILEIITGKKPSVTNLGQYVMEKRKREGLKGVPDRRMFGVEENISASSMIMIVEKKRERNKGLSIRVLYRRLKRDNDDSM